MQCPIHLHAQKYPNRLALITPKGKFTWNDCDQHCDQIPELSLFADLRANRPHCPINHRLPKIVQEEQRQKLSKIKGFATCLYTSGSSSAPKIACHSYANHFYSALGANILIPLEGNDRWLLSLPLFHIGGIAILFRWALAGTCLVISEKGREQHVIQKEKVTHVSFVQTQLKRYDTAALNGLKVILLGGAPLPKLTLPNIYPTYGLTEMSSQVITNDQVLEYRKVKYAPDGEILVKGRTLFKGYYDNGALDLPLNKEGYFSTGDIKLPDGSIARKDRLFISGGENIQPEEVEKALLSLPSVIAARVEGKDDPEYGKRPIAKVILRTFVPEKSLSEALEDVLPKYKIPVEYACSLEKDQACLSSWKS